jgi:hypothetical protein
LLSINFINAFCILYIIFIRQIILI